MMKGKIIILLLLLGALLAACTGPADQGSQVDRTIDKTRGEQYTNITVSDLQVMLQNKDFTFVNVHVPYEGHIAQTDLFIPYDQIDQNLESLPASKDAKIVLYCRGGSMSVTAAQTLAELGYTNVSQLKDGFTSWKAAGLPIETQKPENAKNSVWMESGK